MATGKTNARWCRLLVDGADISGDSRQVGTIGVTHQTQDVTGYNDGAHNFTLGRQNFIFDGYQAVFSDAATTGSHIELNVLEEYVVTFVMGIRAAPALGDPAILQTLEQVSYTVSGSDATLIDAEFEKGQTDISIVKPFGLVLENGTVRTGNLTGTTVPGNGSSTSNGGIGNLHVVETSTDALTIKIQDSPNDSDWTDIITFSADGTSLLGETATQAAGQTCDKDLRVLITGYSSGNYTFWISFARQ